MAEWRVVRSLLTLRDQINALAPGRSKVSDGTIGDAAHQAGTSDHNPARYAALGPIPVVCALDVTQDAAHGADMGPIAEALRLSRDRRIGYVIFNRRITGPNHAWAWDHYSGSDPHTNHMHVSTVHTAAADDTSPWWIAGRVSVSSGKGEDMIYRDDSTGGCYVPTVDGPRQLSEADLAAFQAAGVPMVHLPSYARVEFYCPKVEAAGPADPVTVELGGADLEAALGELLRKVVVTGKLDFGS